MENREDTLYIRSRFPREAERGGLENITSPLALPGVALWPGTRGHPQLSFISPAAQTQGAQAIVREFMSLFLFWQSRNSFSWFSDLAFGGQVLQCFGREVGCIVGLNDMVV